MKKVSKLAIAIAIVAVIISVSVYTTYVYSYNKGYSDGINQVSNTQLLRPGTILTLSPGNIVSFYGYYGNLEGVHNFSVKITGYVHCLNGSNKIEINFMNSINVVKSTGWLNSSKINMSFDVYNTALWKTQIWVVANSRNGGPAYADFMTFPLTVTIKEI